MSKISLLVILKCGFPSLRFFSISISIDEISSGNRVKIPLRIFTPAGIPIKGILSEVTL